MYDGETGYGTAGVLVLSGMVRRHCLPMLRSHSAEESHGVPRKQPGLSNIGLRFLLCEGDQLTRDLHQRS